MHAISSYHGNRPTNTHTRKTGPITIHCAAKLSVQCNTGLHITGRSTTSDRYPNSAVNHSARKAGCHKWVWRTVFLIEVASLLWLLLVLIQIAYFCRGSAACRLLSLDPKPPPSRILVTQDAKPPYFFNLAKITTCNLSHKFTITHFSA